MADQRIGDWLGMPEGRRFWPLDPRASEVRIEDIAHSLANLCRFGGRCSDFYSVAQHSVWVANCVEATHPHLALHALLHDAAEAYVGDAVRPIKADLYFWPVQGRCHAFEEVEAKIMRAIHEAFGLPALTADERAVIKHADNVALATEARDLMGDPQWPGLPEPMAPKVDPWRPGAPSRNAFMVKFNMLRGMTKKQALEALSK